VVREVVDITPDKTLIQKLGLTGYRTEQAISELIDNSIDARTHNEIERIDVTLDFGGEIISVRDNGEGMNLEELQDALTIAKGTKLGKDKLGRFGLGMKSACSTLGKAFTIITTKSESDTEYHTHYDEDEWLKDKNKSWKNFEIETRRKINPWHGTIIKISKLNVALYPNLISRFRKSFGIRYGDYLKQKQVSIFVNTRECKLIEPSIEIGTKKEIKIELTKNNYLRGWIGLLEKRSIKGDYGIHLYKNKRLIKAYDKFGIRIHPEVAKIVGELSLDHVPVNFHKTGFIEDSLEYKEALNAFRIHPTVIDVLRSSIQKKSVTTSIQAILNYFIDETQKGEIASRMSLAKSRTLLEKASNFKISQKNHEYELIFEDKNNEELYTIEEIAQFNYRIKINRKSPVFTIVKNPLFLIGLIMAEAKSIIKNPIEMKDFLRDRNKSWNNFVLNWSEKSTEEKMKQKTAKPKPEKVIPLPNYSLANDLIELHDYIKDKFEFSFQFTALSTLTPFLQNVYNQFVYNIQTEKGTAQNLSEIISEFNPRKYLVMINPKTTELKTALNVSEKKKIFVIKEYSEKFASTWAAPEKAWFDLLTEYRKGIIPIHDYEIRNIFDELMDNNLISEDKLYSIARRKNMIFELDNYFRGT